MEDVEDFRLVLQRSRYEIVQRLQLDRTSLFDYLRSKGVFDASDCEIVFAEKTREQKASKFLDVLESKGKDGFVYFIDVLQLLNPGLYESITGKKASHSVKEIAQQLCISDRSVERIVCKHRASVDVKPRKIGRLVDSVAFTDNEQLVLIEAILEHPDKDPCRIWENMRDKFALGNCGYVPDIELLSGQLKRTIDDLQDLALRNQQLLKENQNLGMKLDQASTDLDLKHRRVEILEKVMNDSERGLVEAHNNANKLNDAVAQQLRTLQQGIFERNTYIIALQMKLLATEEEIKETKRQHEELNSQHEMLSSKWHELSRDYDYERRESLKLSAKLKSQRGNLQKVGEFERKCREFKQINEKMMAERDESLTELDSLKDWTEALKARYDIVVDEFKQLQQSFVTGATENCNLKEEVEELKLQLSLSKIGVQDLKNWNEELEETVKKYREQRDFFSESRKTALQEREEACKERDEAVQRYNDVLKDRDETISRQTKHSQHFEEKYEKACTELKSLRERVTMAELDLEELRLQRKKSTSDDESHTSEQNTTKNNRLDSTTSEESAISPNESTTPESSNFEGFTWKSRREAKSLIQSVRKRVDGTHRQTLSLDRKLDQLKVDGFETLSQEARTSLSLQRGNLLFKTPPTYNTLRFMFGLSVGGHLGSFADVSGGAINGACSNNKDNSEMFTSSSSTSDTSQDEALRAFEKSLDLDDSNKKKAARNTPINDEDDIKKSCNLYSPSKPRPYAKSHSEPILGVNQRLRCETAIDEQQSEDDSERSGEYDESYPGNDELDGEDFHWVREDECTPREKGFAQGFSGFHEDGAKWTASQTKEEEFLKSLSRIRRMPFRQRACAMKKKCKRRSSSVPTISLPENN